MPLKEGQNGTPGENPGAQQQAQGTPIERSRRQPRLDRLQQEMRGYFNEEANRFSPEFKYLELYYNRETAALPIRQAELQPGSVRISEYHQALQQINNINVQIGNFKRRNTDHQETFEKMDKTGEQLRVETLKSTERGRKTPNFLQFLGQILDDVRERPVNTSSNPSAK